MTSHLRLCLSIKIVGFATDLLIHKSNKRKTLLIPTPISTLNMTGSNSNESGVTGAAKFVTSTLGNTVGGLTGTVGNVVGAAGRGLGETVTGATGSAGKDVGKALGDVSIGNPRCSSNEG
jgi:hypothetical protein